MNSRDIPCGCRVTWNERQTKVLVCTLHQLKYVVWRGTDLEFIRRIVTPTLQKADMIEFGVGMAHSDAMKRSAQ